MSYERGINVNVRDLRKCLEGLPDNMDVIIPVCVEGDENTILCYRHARTIGILESPREEKPAFCIATAADGADMDTLTKLNAGDTTCKKVLF